MPTIWSLITPQAREKLAKLQRRRYHTDLNPPHESDGVKVDLVVTEQDIRDMSLPANDHRLRGGEDG